jgi:hypothetical protein
MPRHGAAKIERLLNEHSPRVLPPAWELREDYTNARVYHRLAPRFLSVITEVAEYDGRLWLHVSCAARAPDAHATPQLPTWEELKEVKDLFCGRDSCALQVLPPASEYVNVNPSVLHLWVALEGARPVPDFTRGSRNI